MNEARFREALESRHIAPDTIERSVGAVQRFETWVQARRPGTRVEAATAVDLHHFALGLAGTRDDVAADLLAIARYARLAGNDDLVVAILEQIDGAEVPERLRNALGEIVGADGRDAVFAGLEIPAIAAPQAEKSAFMRTLLRRLSDEVAPAEATTALKANLHYQPKELFAEEREAFLAAPDIDSFLADRRRRYLEFLTQLHDERALYYTQPITDDVLEYVRSTPACQTGVREGRTIRVTKIPYQADRYLHAADERERRYACCHCPWARESILDPQRTVPARLCECSAGFEEQYWDAVFDRQVSVEVVRSALRGDDICEFEVRIPEGVAVG